MTYRFLVVLWLLTLANIYDSKSSYNSPAYSLAVYGLVNTFNWIGLVRRKKGCDKVWCSPFKIKPKKKTKEELRPLEITPMVNPLPSASLVVRSPWKPQWNLREREGGVEVEAVRQGWFEHDSLPTTSWETGRSILKRDQERGGDFFFPQSLSKGWGLVDQSLKTIKLPFFLFAQSFFGAIWVFFLLELSKYELISGTLWEQEEFI